MNIVIVGLGVIGGSIGLALRRAGYKEVFGVDTDPHTLQKAEKLGIIQKGSRDGKELFQKAQLVYLCIYPRALPAFIRENAGFFRPGTVLTDVSGIKGDMPEALPPLLPKGVDFVFGHPMAGREKRGIDFASADVFHGANYLIAPIPRNTEEHLLLVEGLARDMGFGRISRISPGEHDQFVAYTSQLPHAIAVALVNSGDPRQDTAALIGDSYRDLTRIAKINAGLWSELFLENRENLMAAVVRFELELDRIKAALEQCDTAALMDRFAESTCRREALDGAKFKQPK